MELKKTKNRPIPYPFTDKYPTVVRKNEGEQMIFNENTPMWYVLMALLVAVFGAV